MATKKSQEKFGDRLQRLREAAGFSQSQAAEVAKVPIGSLQGWEQNRRLPRVDRAARLARAFGVSLDEHAAPVLSTDH